MLLEVVFVLYEKVATNGTFVTTVSYGTHIFYFFWVEGCSLIYDGYQHIPLTHSFHMLCLFFTHRV